MWYSSSSWWWCFVGVNWVLRFSLARCASAMDKSPNPWVLSVPPCLKTTGVSKMTPAPMLTPCTHSIELFDDLAITPRSLGVLRTSASGAQANPPGGRSGPLPIPFHLRRRSRIGPEGSDVDGPWAMTNERKSSSSWRLCSDRSPKRSNDLEPEPWLQSRESLAGGSRELQRLPHHFIHKKPQQPHSGEIAGWD